MSKINYKINERSSSLLVVLGNVTCKNLLTLGDILITGNLQVDNVILGDSLCDYVLYVEGEIKTETILDYGHSIKSFKKISAKNIFSFNAVEDKDGRIKPNIQPEDLLEELLDDDFQSLPKTYQYIETGGNIFTKQINN